MLHRGLANRADHRCGGKRWARADRDRRGHRRRRLGRAGRAGPRRRARRRGRAGRPAAAGARRRADQRRRPPVAVADAARAARALRRARRPPGVRRWPAATRCSTASAPRSPGCSGRSGRTCSPHPSSVSLACARLGWAVDERRDRQRGRPAARPGAPRCSRRAGGCSCSARTRRRPAAVAALLADAGYGDSALTVLEQLGGPGERRRATARRRAGRTRRATR